MLASRLALFLGAISFPLYLLHVIPLFWLEYRVVVHGLGGTAIWVAIAAYVLGCLGAAFALHVLVERPTVRIAHRIARSRPRWDPLRDTEIAALS